MTRTRIFIGLIATPFLLALIFVVGILLAKVGYEVMGYHAFVWNGEKIAQLALENHNPKECGKIRVVFAINTNTYFESQYCVYTYAKISQDPSACELILPSDYGQDCLGTVASLLLTGVGCSSYASGEILCSSGVKGRNIGIDTCAKYHEPVLKTWCYTERSRLLPNVNDCEKIPATSSILRDDCVGWYALKMKDPMLCESIQNAKMKKICELKIRYTR